MSHNGQISEVPRANGLGPEQELHMGEMGRTEAKWGAKSKSCGQQSDFVSG